MALRQGCNQSCSLNCNPSLHSPAGAQPRKRCSDGEKPSLTLNGKPAIEWVMERQAVKTDTKSGITNDANAYATKTVGDPRFPFDLLCRVISVSLETVNIVRGLPKFDI